MNEEAFQYPQTRLKVVFVAPPVAFEVRQVRSSEFRHRYKSINSNG
jgi:hypothetical protein